MKKIILTLLFLNFAGFVFSQNSREQFSGQASLVKRENLNAAKRINDVIPDCPRHWPKIINIVSVTMAGYSDGQKVSAESPDEILTGAQKNILNVSDLGTVISIEIKFRWKDTLAAIGDYGKIKVMNEFRLAVVPEVEAEYPGGSVKITQYLNDSLFPKIRELSEYKNIPGAKGIFTVDEEGQITGARLFSQSKSIEIDKIFLAAINNMPKWKAAQNADGKKVKQVFIFNVYFPYKSEVASGSKRGSGC